MPREQCKSLMGLTGTAIRCVLLGANLSLSQSERRMVNPQPSLQELTTESTIRHNVDDNPQNTSFGMAENLERKQYWLGSVEKEQREFLETVAKRVHDHGKGLLNALRDNERINPKFSFLFDTEVTRKACQRADGQCAEHHVLNYFLDDKYAFPPARAVTFDDEGYASFCSTDSAEEKDQKEYGKACLGRLARQRFEAMLRGMTGKRAEIARAMEFSLKHAEAADEVCTHLSFTLTLDCRHHLPESMHCRDSGAAQGRPTPSHFRYTSQLCETGDVTALTSRPLRYQMSGAIDRRSRSA